MKLKLKSGVMEGIQIAIALGSSVVGLMLYTIIVAAVRDSQATTCFNTTGGTAAPYASCGLSWNIANSGLSLFTGVTSQFSTIGNLTGVLILASVVFAFGFGGYMLYQKTKKGE